MLTLWDYYRSSACFRVRIALNLKNLDYQVIPVHLINNGGEQFSAAYQKINPQGLVPALQVGNYTLTQSLAIIEYLEEMYPKPALLPDNPVVKAWVRAFALSIAADIHPLNNLRVLKFLTNNLQLTEEQKNIWYQNWIHIGLTGLENQISAHNTHDFCFGEQPTMADICLVPQMYNAKRFSCDLSLFPNLVRIDANCQKLGAFAKAWPLESVT